VARRPSRVPEDREEGAEAHPDAARPVQHHLRRAVQEGRGVPEGSDPRARAAGHGQQAELRARLHQGGQRLLRPGHVVRPRGRVAASDHHRQAAPVPLLQEGRGEAGHRLHDAQALLRPVRGHRAAVAASQPGRPGQDRALQAPPVLQPHQQLQPADCSSRRSRRGLRHPAPDSHHELLGLLRGLRADPSFCCYVVSRGLSESRWPPS